MIEIGVRVDRTGRPHRLAVALRTLRGHPALNDKQTISSDTSKAWINPSTISGSAGLSRNNGNQPIRAANKSAGCPTPVGSPNASVRRGVPPEELASLSQARLQELLHYDPETGVFTWRVDRVRVRAGERAGKVTRDGYIEIGVDGKRYGAHRLAFLYMSGAIPSSYVDHINLTKSDNRWCNLRPASSSQNQMNTSGRPNNTSGFKGVSWHPREERWRADIRVDGKKKCLGYFDTPEDGYDAYCAAAKSHYGEFARLA